MILTQNEILTHVYKLVKASPIASTITGQVLKGTRPTDSKVEDCILTCIKADTTKFLQPGLLQIKVFTNAIREQQTYYEDVSRNSIIERLLIDFSEELVKDTTIQFLINTRQFRIVPLDTSNSKQYYVIFTIDYTITNH